MHTTPRIDLTCNGSQVQRIRSLLVRVADLMSVTLDNVNRYGREVPWRDLKRLGS